MLSINLLQLFLFIRIISNCISIDCNDKNSPYLINNNYCSSTCVEGQSCVVHNEIIKTQWLNGIIYLNEQGYPYTNIAVSQKNNLFFLSTQYPENNLRLFYLLNEQGYGYLDRDNPKYFMTVNDNETHGRFESELFTIKLYESDDDKEYLINVSKADQFVEIYDFDNNMSYIEPIMTAFGSLESVYNVIGVHLKLKSAEKENKNTYLIGLLVCEFDNCDDYGYVYLKKVSFTSIDIKNNKPSCINQEPIECSKSTIVSCYETNKFYIICFYQKKNYKYTIIVYNSNLEEKKQLEIVLGFSGEKYDEWFFKCIHFFNETGVFAYFTTDYTPSLVFEFNRYIDSENSIINEYSSIEKYTINGYEFNFDKEKITLCDMIKVEDKKFFFVGTTGDKTVLVIILLCNYKEEYFSKRLYSLKIKAFYDFQVGPCLRLTFYKQFLTMGYSYLNETLNWASFPALVIFGYSKTIDTELDLLTYMYNHNETKIYNLTLELQAKYIIENNIFGYIYFGVEIIENCAEAEEDIYLADLNGQKIISDYFVPKNEKIKLKIPKKNSYSPFECNFKYASVVTEPKFSEFNKYAEVYDGRGDEEEFYENNKKNYIGRYSNYKLISNYNLKDACEEICDLCYTSMPTSCIVCKYSSHFEGSTKICEEKPPETEITETEGVTEITSTEGVTQITSTEGVIEKTSTEVVTEKTSTGGVIQITTTEDVTQITSTEGVTQITKTDGIKEINDTTDKPSDFLTQVQTDKPKDTDILSKTNQISDKDDTDKTSKTNTDDIDIITSKISDKYNTDEVSQTNNQNEKDTTDNPATEHNILSEISETDKVTNSDNITETEKLSEIYNDEFTNKEITNKIIEKCNFTEIIENKCKGEITSNQVNQVYTHITTNLIKNKNNTVIKTDNTIFQVSQIDQQKDLSIPTISNVDLGDCEKLLKLNKSIPDDEQLIIFKIDSKNVEEYSTYVQYEIYNPLNFQKLELDICKDLNIKIYPPVYLDEKTKSLFSDLDKSGYNLFNSSDSFYNDFCTPYTTESGADIILEDRQKDIYNNFGKKALCQKGCILEYYNQIINKAKCDCTVQKIQINLEISDLQSGKTVLKDSFLNTLSNANFQILRCYKLAIDLTAIFENIGRFIMTILLFSIVILFILYYIYGSKKIFTYLQDIINQKIYSNNINSKKNKHKRNIKNKQIKRQKPKSSKHVNFIDNIQKKNKKMTNIFKKRLNSNPKSTIRTNPVHNNEKKNILTGHNKKKEKNKVNIYRTHKNSEDNSRDKFNDFKKNTTKLIKIDRKINKKKTVFARKMIKPSPPRKKVNLIDNKNNSMESFEKTGISHHKIISSKKVIVKIDKKKKKHLNKRNLKEHHFASSEKKNNNILKSNSIDKLLADKEIKSNYFTSQELNTMKYQEALIYDKRTYLQYYWSLIKKKQLLLFTFINYDDYNLVIIKFALFLLSFSLYLTINGFFFRDEDMHKLYKTNGIYDIIIEIPKIFYSTLVTAVINMILKTLSLSESAILEFKKVTNIDNARSMSRKIWFCIKTKITLFCILSFLLMSFFWYYISCFCAVYKNTQKILIKDTLLSFCLSMLYPFGLNLLPGFFRIPALRSRKKNKECLYKFSIIVSII